MYAATTRRMYTIWMPRTACTSSYLSHLGLAPCGDLCSWAHYTESLDFSMSVTCRFAGVGAE